MGFTYLLGGGRGSFLANPIKLIVQGVCLVGDFGSCPMGHISCQKRGIHRGSVLFLLVALRKSKYMLLINGGPINTHKHLSISCIARF